jgi:hypothetical protein
MSTPNQDAQRRAVECDLIEPLAGSQAALVTRPEMRAPIVRKRVAAIVDKQGGVARLAT